MATAPASTATAAQRATREAEPLGWWAREGGRSEAARMSVSAKIRKAEVTATRSPSMEPRNMVAQNVQQRNCFFGGTQ